MSLWTSVSFCLRHPIGARRPLRCLASLAGWQVRSRLLRGAQSVPWVGGTRLVVERGMTGATGNIYVGLHEFEEMALTLHLLRPDDLMVDVGANVGSYTVLGAGAAKARVIAFEPIAATFAALARNVEANGLAQRVVLLPTAVGARVGVVRMESGHGAMNRVLGAAETSATSSDVAMTTLDAALAGVHPTLLKVDVEGHEASVVAGAHAVLARTAAVIIEVGAGRSAAFEALAAAGLVPCTYDPWERRLERQSVPCPNARGNALFVRDLGWAAARCLSAARYGVKGLEV